MTEFGESLSISRSQQVCFSRILQILGILKYHSETSMKFDDIDIITSALRELDEICQKLMMCWKQFCIVPLLYLIEPVFRSLKIMIIFPNVHIVIASSRFLSSLIHYHVKLYSTIVVERMFSSIFDVATLAIMAGSATRAFQLYASGMNQDNQFLAMASRLGLLSDLLEEGAKSQYLGCDFVFALFDLYVFMLSKLNIEDDLHKDLISKCSAAFPTILKLRSKADIVASSLERGSEESITGIVTVSISSNLRLESWAALGSEIFPCLMGTFSECSHAMVSETLLHSSEHSSNEIDFLGKIAQRGHFVGISKLFVRTTSAIHCVRVIIDALNRWKSHFATGDAYFQIEKLKSTWFGQKSILLFLLVYCFDLSEIIRNQAVSTLKVIGAFFPSLFTKFTSRQLLFDVLSATKALSTCPRFVCDINWLQGLCSNIDHCVLLHGLQTPPVL